MEPATSLARRLFGTDEPVEPALPLRAGPLTMRLRRGRLLHLCCDGHEVWHGLAFVLRDADWGTPEPVFEHRCVETFDGGFSVRLEGGFPVTPPVRLVVSIEGHADGRLRFDAEATPEGDIEANRIGLCLMHPAAAGGAAVEIGHVDGRSSRSTLPRLIPPWPPFMLIRTVAHEWTDGRWADAELLGDSFELEDQRNNADDSFKTYSRSNLMPRPYRLPAGVPIRQSALLSLRLQPSTAASTTAATGVPAPTGAAPIVVEVGEACGDLPRIGIEIHARDTHADAALLDALRRLRPAHLHLSLLDDGDASGVEPRGLAALLAASGARLRLDVADVAAASALLAASNPSDVAVLPSEAHSLAAARRAFPGARIGGGTRHYFAQLHRLDRLDGVDFVSFTTSPLVHGADDDEVMAGLASLPAMIETLHARWPGALVQVGPSTIGVRRSPLGRQPASDGTRRLALAARDPRCGAQFGAAWALGHVAAFASSGGVEALTLMSLGGDSALFACGRPTPACHLLSRLGRPARRLRVANGAPRRVAALAFEHGRPARAADRKSRPRTRPRRRAVVRCGRPAPARRRRRRLAR